MRLIPDPNGFYTANVGRRHTRRRASRRSRATLLCVGLLSGLLLLPAAARGEARVVYPPYGEQKVVFDFFFDAPVKIGPALYWLRALVNPLLEEPYNQAPELMDVVVIIHGTEIVSTVKHNYAKYKDAVDRMKYYAELGVKFRVCALASHDYGYTAADFHDFIEVTPSALTELAHWQQQGYSLIVPQVTDKKYTVDEIR